jgi:hypothetical protein
LSGVAPGSWPWRFSKAGFVDHIAFHATQWESFQWVSRDLRFQVRGDTGIVSGYATFRGKPKDCGFRQRFMGFTQTWLRGADGWKMLCCTRVRCTARLTMPHRAETPYKTGNQILRLLMLV